MENTVGRDVAAPPSTRSSLHWVQAGLIVFSFAAPSAVMAVPYAIGMAGFVGGGLICVTLTTASVAGSMMLLAVRQKLPQPCHTFGELGGAVLGPAGRYWGNAIQLGNFCLFLPCALQFTALALAGLGDGLPGFGSCTDYYVFVIALLCLVTTQARSLSNTKVLSCVSVLCVIGMAVMQVLAAFNFENRLKVPAQLFGNPASPQMVSWIRACGGFTISSWSFVPAFLTVELADSMSDAASFHKSLILAGVCNICLFAFVGFPVVSKWGYNVGEVITVTKGVDAWKPGSVDNTTFNAFLLVGNFVSYMLDSVPLGRYCQRTWAPSFKDTWSPADIGRYLLYTLPTFLIGLLLAVFVPSVKTLLDFTTAFTTPWVTQIYPAVLYWSLHRRNPGLLASSAAPEASATGQNRTEVTTMSRVEAFGVAAVFIIGCISFMVCFAKAIGYVALEELRPTFQIGCDDWTIWSNE